MVKWCRFVQVYKKEFCFLGRIHYSKERNAWFHGRCRFQTFLCFGSAFSPWFHMGKVFIWHVNISVCTFSLMTFEPIIWLWPNLAGWMGLKGIKFLRNQWKQAVGQERAFLTWKRLQSDLMCLWAPGILPGKALLPVPAAGRASAGAASHGMLTSGRLIHPDAYRNDFFNISEVEGQWVQLMEFGMWAFASWLCCMGMGREARCAHTTSCAHTASCACTASCVCALGQWVAETTRL